MKQPQLNLRVPDQHQEIVRQIAARLRESSGDAFAAQLTTLLEDFAPPPPAPGIDAVDHLHTRVAELEDTVSVLRAELDQERFVPLENGVNQLYWELGQMKDRIAKLEAPPPAPTKRLKRDMVKSSLQKI